MPEVLSRRRLNRALLARQALLERERTPATTMVQRLAGIQAQEAAPPFVGLWSRIDGFEREELLDALHGRVVVRATAMRGTIHLLHAADYARLRWTLQPVLRTALRMPDMRRVAEDADLDAVLALAHRLLTEEPRPIARLEGPLHDAYPQLDGHAAAQVARMLLPLVQVPTPGHPDGFAQNAAFAPAELLLGRPVSRAEDRDELARRYLAAFGPATAADATKWSGLTGMGAVLAGLDDVVRFEDEEGRTLFDLRDAPRPPEDVVAPVRFLPRFDNVLLSHVHHERILDPAHRPHVLTKNGIVFGTVLVDGHVVATWSSTVDGDGACLRVAPFRRPSQRTAASIRAEGRRLLAFLAPASRPREVEVGPAVGAG